MRAGAEGVLRLGAEVMTVLVFFEFSDGLIVRITDFWPEAYEPPVRVSRLVSADSWNAPER